MNTFHKLLSACTIVLFGVSPTYSQLDEINQLTGPYLGQDPPGNIPQLFAPPEIQSNQEWFWHGPLAFSPDSTEFYLDLYYPDANPSGMRVRQMTMNKNQWTDIEIAPFAGEYVAAGMSFLDNGDKVYFVSVRPGGINGGFWVSERLGDVWMDPTPVEVPFSSGLGSGWRVSIANDLTMYAHFFTGGGQYCNIYAVEYIDGQYQEPQILGDHVNSSYMDINAFIDPDEEYLIFSSARPEGYGISDLYISFWLENDTWSEAINFGSPINTLFEEGSAYVSPDKQFLFFNSTRNGDRNPYWVSTSVIDSLRQVVVSIKETGHLDYPDIFIENHPNPFHDMTKFIYTLMDPDHVTLIIYDNYGRIIKTLINEYQLSGIHSVNFYRRNLNEGLYFYTIQIGNTLSESNKMIILRNP